MNRNNADRVIEFEHMLQNAGKGKCHEGSSCADDGCALGIDCITSCGDANQTGEHPVDRRLGPEQAIARQPKEHRHATAASTRDHCIHDNLGKGLGAGGR